MTGSNDRTAKVWDVRTGTALAEIRGHSSTVQSVAFSPDGTQILTGGGDQDKPGEAYVWDTRTGMVRQELNAHTNAVMEVSFSPDGNRIVTCGQDRMVMVWDTTTGTVLLKLEGHASGVGGVAYSPDGMRIVSTDGTIAKVWDARTGATLKELKGSPGLVQSAAFSPDSTRIITAGWEDDARFERTGIATVWDANSGMSFFQMKWPSGRVQHAAFSLDGTRIVTWEGTDPKLWDARTGQEVQGEPIPKTVPNERISPDRRLAAHEDGNRVELLPLKPDPYELAYRQLHMQPKSGRYREGYLAARAADDEFAARFFLNLIPPADRVAMETKAEIEALAPLSKLAQSFQQSGRSNQALPLFIKVMEVRKAKLGPEDPDTLRSMADLAEAYQQAGKLDLAVPLYEETWELEKAKLGPGHPDTLKCMNNLGVTYFLSKRLDKSIPLFEENLMLKEAKFGRKDIETVCAIANLGVNYKDAGRLKEAIPLLEEAWRAAASEPLISNSTNALIEAYMKAGENAKLVSMLTDIVNTKKANLGPQHLETLEALKKLAVAYFQLRQLDKSVPLLEEVFKGRETKLGRDHPETLNAMANLGVNYREAGRFAEAIQLLEEIQRALTQHSNLKWVIPELLDTYMRAGEFTKLADLARENWPEIRKMAPKDSPQLAQILAIASTGFLHTKAFDEAEPLLRECLALREKIQPDIWSTCNTKSMLGGALLGQKKYADAEPLLLAGYEGMKQREKTIPPQGKVRMTEAIERLVQLYEALDKKDDAAKWRGELEAIKAAQNPEAKP